MKSKYKKNLLITLAVGLRCHLVCFQHQMGLRQKPGTCSPFHHSYSARCYCLRAVRAWDLYCDSYGNFGTSGFGTKNAGDSLDGVRQFWK